MGNRRVVPSLFLIALATSSLLWGEESFQRGDWPFQPLERPGLPAVVAALSCDSPIDAFVVEKLDARGLSLSAPADKLTLLRRLHFDVIGLPPTIAEQDAFLRDEQPDAVERLLDRLLASPRYGERWGRYWLDLVRYAESAGYKVDELRPDAYRYRDYVIQAWNEDLPYDRFLMEQLAGDEFAPEDRDAVVATGMQRMYPEESTASNFVQARQAILDDVTEVTGLVFLGLTMGCARCHDHKFDPIEQADYFRLQACFAGMVGRNDSTTASPAEVALYRERLAAWESATQTIREEMDRLTRPHWPGAFEEVAVTLDPETAKAIRTPVEQRTAYQISLASLVDRMLVRKMSRLPRRLEGAEKERYEALQKELSTYDHLKPAPLPTAMTISDAPGEAPATFVLAAGDYRKPGQEVTPGFPVFLGNSEPRATDVTSPGPTSGRRLALAKWLGRRDHPLTARVMVNRIWQQLLGVGIVPTANDFGAMGGAPTHATLLDWLAAEFVDRGWSLKSVQRAIITSATYRQDSTVYVTNPVHHQAQAADGENAFLWRARRRRLEGELIRDAALHLTGDLNLRMFGPSARPKLPEAVLKNSRFSWEPDPLLADQHRRSVYVFSKRNLRLPILGAFDPPDIYRSTPQRGETVTALQTLTVLNSEFTLEQARRWAGKLLEGPDPAAALRTPAGRAERIGRAYREAFGRLPDSVELEVAESFWQRQTGLGVSGPVAAELMPEPNPGKLSPAEGAAWVDLCHALLNCNEFLYID